MANMNIKIARSNMNKKQSKIRIGLIIAIILVLIFALATIFWRKHVENYSMTIDEAGLTILNDYEFPLYLIEEDKCMRPYDVGDGVITFGPGITYSDEQSGLDDINSRFDTEYTADDDCIDVDILHQLQRAVISDYEAIVNHVAIWHFKHFTQDQFNGLVLLAYNSPNLFNDEEFIKVILSDTATQEEYIEAANNYYKTLNSYYDNPNTEEADDGFGNGWYNRIVDSSEVYFGIDYDYQNSVEY